MSREMIVGGTTMVGATRQHDYDELMELGAEPAHHGHPHAPAHHHPGAPHMQGHPGHPAPPHPGALHPMHMQQHPHYEGHPMHPHPHAIQEAPQPPQRRRLISEEPTHERQFPIGFIMQNIQPNDEEDIEVKPQVYFRGERLAIPPTLARYFDILDIKVGKDSQLAATGSMPGESFSALAVGVRMELDTAKPGIVITLRVRNIDTQAHDFKAVMYGAVLE